MDPVPIFSPWVDGADRLDRDGAVKDPGTHLWVGLPWFCCTVLVVQILPQVGGMFPVFPRDVLIFWRGQRSPCS